ncbi:MAG: deoxyribose-phosphate aldolase [Planctomycetota bacterium]
MEVAEARGTTSEIAQLIDHTLLKPDATPRDIEQLCQEALRFRFKSVCINPIYVSLARQHVGDSGVHVCAVVGFPLGANLTATKVEETRRALADGASEIDMVLPVGMLKAGRHSYVAHDIMEVVHAAGHGTVVKVILETCLLEKQEKIHACRLAREAGASFVKTSTGFSSGGATPEDVRLMRREVGEDLGVKASGGIRDLDDVLNMVRSGASRIGASASVAIVSGKSAALKSY